ncbi:MULTISPECIES: hypothetical protein [Listeria]|uniref:hypothetical protein n=1 Tax=Listeria TaxID=1637 RepID=UPI000B5901D0|nr:MULTISPECIES: hypothetical protein [Listeria]
MEQAKAALILERSLYRLESEVEQTLSGYVTPFLGDNSGNRLKIGYALLFSTRFQHDARKNGVIRLLLDEELEHGAEAKVLALLGRQFVVENAADEGRMVLAQQAMDLVFIPEDLSGCSLRELHRLALDLQLFVVAEKLYDEKF